MVAMAVPAYLPLPSAPPAHNSDIVGAPEVALGDRAHVRRHAIVGDMFIFLTFFAGPLVDWVTHHAAPGNSWCRYDCGWRRANFGGT